jgi:hypothetical protein
VGFVYAAATTLAQYKVDYKCGIGIISGTVVSRGLKLSSRGLSPCLNRSFTFDLFLWFFKLSAVL